MQRGIAKKPMDKLKWNSKNIYSINANKMWKGRLEEQKTHRTNRKQILEN